MTVQTDRRISTDRRRLPSTTMVVAMTSEVASVVASVAVAVTHK
eukprot:gene8879-biopygen2773